VYLRGIKIINKTIHLINIVSHTCNDGLIVCMLMMIVVYETEDQGEAGHPKKVSCVIVKNIVRKKKEQIQ